MGSPCVLHISWNQYLERWILKDMFGANVFELPDCGNFRRLFGDMSKDHENCVVLSAENKGVL